MLKLFMIWTISIQGFNCGNHWHELEITQSFACVPGRCDDLIGPTNAYLQGLASAMQAQSCASEDAYSPWVVETVIERPGHGKNGRNTVLHHPGSNYHLSVCTQVWAPRTNLDLFYHQLNMGPSRTGPIDFAHDGRCLQCGPDSTANGF